MAQMFTVNVYSIDGQLLDTPRSKAFPGTGNITFDTIPSGGALRSGMYGEINFRGPKGWNKYQVVETVAQLVAKSG
jgi:hypothetical protein